MRRVTVLLALCLVACSSSSQPVASGTTPTPTVAQTPPTPTPAPTPPAPAAPDVRLSSAACGFGGSATAVSTLVDVDATTAVHGITATFEMIDASTHRPVGHERAPVTLLVSPPGRGTSDFSTQGTSPFSGELTAGQHVRLQIFAGLDGDAPFPGPAEIRTTLHAADGRTWSIDCTAPSMWPSS